MSHEGRLLPSSFHELQLKLTMDFVGVNGMGHQIGVSSTVSWNSFEQGQNQPMQLEFGMALSF